MNNLHLHFSFILHILSPAVFLITLVNNFEKQFYALLTETKLAAQYAAPTSTGAAPVHLLSMAAKYAAATRPESNSSAPSLSHAATLLPPPGNDADRPPAYPGMLTLKQVKIHDFYDKLVVVIINTALSLAYLLRALNFLFLLD